MSRKLFAGAALLAAILSTPAAAIPIAFDFSGVVQRRTVFDHGSFTEDLSGQGQSFSARVVIDTSLMTLSQFDSFAGGRQHWQSTNWRRDCLASVSRAGAVAPPEACAQR